jgi:hypothetical protein
VDQNPMHDASSQFSCTFYNNLWQVARRGAFEERSASRRLLAPDIDRAITTREYNAYNDKVTSGVPAHLHCYRAHSACSPI